jgi:vacuolar-type H+-ATPase subunit I/STV1
MTGRQERIKQIERELKRLENELNSLQEKEAQDSAPYFVPSKEPVRVENYGGIKIPVYH